MEKQTIEQIVERYEKTLNWRRGGDIEDRVEHCLSQMQSVADNAIHTAKVFLQDTKTQFKALEVILEGLSDSGLNHTHKRVIANHLITMLRSMVDRIDNTEYKYDFRMADRFNFYRSNVPENRLIEKHKEAKFRVLELERFVSQVKSKAPDLEINWPFVDEKKLNEPDSSEEIPF